MQPFRSACLIVRTYKEYVHLPEVIPAAKDIAIDQWAERSDRELSD
jgi:hypothetical protein